MERPMSDSVDKFQQLVLVHGPDWVAGYCAAYEEFLDEIKRTVLLDSKSQKFFNSNEAAGSRIFRMHEAKQVLIQQMKENLKQSTDPSDLNSEPKIS